MRALHIVSISGASATNAELTSILAEYTALEQVRIFRRLLLPKCAMVSVAIAVGGALGWLPPLAAWSVGLAFVALPALVWLAELRRERRLSKKVIKSP
jgi:putative effector of murein hydrolase